MNMHNNKSDEKKSSFTIMI